MLNNSIGSFLVLFVAFFFKFEQLRYFNIIIITEAFSVDYLLLL